MAENDAEKTEDPTPRRRQEARRDGNVAKSADLTAALALLATVFLIYVFGMQLMANMKASVEAMLSGGMGENPTRADDVNGSLAYTFRLAVGGAAPIMLSIAAVTLLAAVGQVGFMVTGKPLMPEFSKINPLSGMKRLVDARAGVRLVMSLAKVALILGVASWIIAIDLQQILGLAQLEVRQLFMASAELVFLLALKLAALLLALAVVDYSFQRWQRERDLRMSKQEIKEEMKRMDGDPLVKQRRSRVARQLALQRVGQAVPQADVIVTNPTHYAIALKYNSDEMRAPKVVAKGADFLAMRIRQLAVANGVPIVERKELARSLYAVIEPGDEIPPEYYSAVAEILAYVYRLSGRRSA